MFINDIYVSDCLGFLLLQYVAFITSSIAGAPQAINLDERQRGESVAGTDSESFKDEKSETEEEKTKTTQTQHEIENPKQNISQNTKDRATDC